MYATGDTECLASTISGPIRVLANNDVPTGAAFIKLQLHPNQEWDGWSPREFQPRLPDSIKFDTMPNIAGRENSHSVSSNETDYVFSEGMSLHTSHFQCFLLPICCPERRCLKAPSPAQSYLIKLLW